MKYSILGMLALLNVCCAVWAKEPLSDSSAVHAVSSSHEAAFVVDKNSVVSSEKGDVETAKEDTLYITSALANIDVDLSEFNYQVDVYKQDYADVLSGEEKDLVAFLYQLTFDNFSDISAKKLSQLQKKDYQKTYISPSKAPVQCYAFVASESLKLLCHYGFNPPSKIAGMVEGLKAGS
ncbi:MAG: hypothetical protein ACRBBR_02630 [Cellvibrionaceae bacterium]